MNDDRRYVYNNNIDYSHFTKAQSVNRWTKENLEEKITNSKTYIDVLNKLGVIPSGSAYDRLKYYIKKYQLKFESQERVYITKEIWRKEHLYPIIKKSSGYAECLINMNLKPGGDNFKTLKKYIKKYNLSIVHFDKPHNSNRKKKLNEILVENSSYNRVSLKNRLYKEGLKERKCEMCGQGEEWNGKKMSLIIDHINGIYNDNRLENLRIVCPNCNATLDTHAGKNIKLKKDKSSDKNIKKTKRKPNPKSICECGNEKHSQAVKCKSCYSSGRRKVERPPNEILQEDVKMLGYRGAGRKYGVSDNAIRKWLKSTK